MNPLPYCVRVDDDPPAECTHFSDGETAQAYYNALVLTVYAGKHAKVALLKDGEIVSDARRNDRKLETE